MSYTHDYGLVARIFKGAAHSVFSITTNRGRGRGRGRGRECVCVCVEGEGEGESVCVCVSKGERGGVLV